MSKFLTPTTADVADDTSNVLDDSNNTIQQFAAVANTDKLLQEHLEQVLGTTGAGAEAMGVDRHHRDDNYNEHRGGEMA